MVNRGDLNHDIAAWFGVNQGRIPEVKAGEYGTLEATPADQLPPRGAPGIKGRKLRDAVGKIIELLQGDPETAGKTLQMLEDAAAKFDANGG